MDFSNRQVHLVPGGSAKLRYIFSGKGRMRITPRVELLIFLCR
jgi:hypothetical protein